MALLALGLYSCSDFGTLNIDSKVPDDVEGGTLFANATWSLFERMGDCNVNTNNFRLYAQQWAQTTYADESNYELVERNVNGAAYTRYYTTVIRDLRGLAVQNENDVVLTEEHKRNQAAIAEVLEIYTWHVLVDLFGDIPYSEAFTDDVTPKYDDDAVIYADLISRLDNAISNLSGESRLDAYDLIYGGDTGQWRKFANSLKLRLAIRIADTDSGKAGKMVEDAIADGVFESSADDCKIYWTGSPPYNSPLWDDLVQSGRSDFVAANTIVDVMNNLNDPRRPYFFKDQYDGEWLGGAYGDNNNYNAFSHPGTLQHDPAFPSSILSYTEVQFLLADAAERGYNVGGSAANFYNEGITASILEWGGTEAEATAYLGNSAVAYATAPGTWKEKIALQKWLALYDRGFEAWTTWRLYDAPTMNEAIQAMRMPLLRYTYPVSEYSLNEENVAAAAAAIGGDNLDSKIFWDVN